VDHLESHIFAVSLHTDFPTLLPAVALIASGGHSDLYYVSQDLTLKLIGCTRDDAAGEAFDKGARALGLGYPGGPAIDKCARVAHPPYPTFPIPSLGVEYSFSGIKTALVRFVERGMEGFSLEQAAFAYQEAICRQLVAGCRAALQQTAAGTLIVCGGVAANSRLRQMARELTDELAVRLAIPPLELCTDNAAMIAARGWFVFRSRGADSLRFDAYATSRIL
jgi:N6-L-threonylcarbamoyladenine synthase